MTHAEEPRSSPVWALPAPMMRRTTPPKPGCPPALYAGSAIGPRVHAGPLDRNAASCRTGAACGKDSYVLSAACGEDCRGGRCLLDAAHARTRLGRPGQGRLAAHGEARSRGRGCGRQVGPRAVRRACVGPAVPRARPERERGPGRPSQRGAVVCWAGAVPALLLSLAGPLGLWSASHRPCRRGRSRDCSHATQQWRVPTHKGAGADAACAGNTTAMRVCVGLTSFVLAGPRVLYAGIFRLDATAHRERRAARPSCRAVVVPRARQRVAPARVRDGRVNHQKSPAPPLRTNAGD